MLSIPTKFMVISGLFCWFNHRLNQPPHHASGRGCRSRRRLRRCLRRGAAAWFLENDFRWDVFLIEGSLEVKLPTIWTDEKKRWSRRIEKRREEKRREEKRREEKRREEMRREEKGREGKRREAKGSEGKGREEKRREGKGREGKRREEKRREGKKREDQRRERVRRKSQKKEDAGVRKGRKVAKYHVFPMICSSGGSKSRLAKVASWPDER